MCENKRNSCENKRNSRKHDITYHITILDISIQMIFTDVFTDVFVDLVEVRLSKRFYFTRGEVLGKRERGEEERQTWFICSAN